MRALNSTLRILGNQLHQSHLLPCQTALFRIRTLGFNTQCCSCSYQAQKLKIDVKEINTDSRKLEKQPPLILHVVPRARTLPSPSPFVMKLWTYMNLAQIPYIIDTKKSIGPKGKSPWISIDGKEIGDSQIIIKYLSKKFGIDLNKPYTPEQLAVSTATRIMLEEHYAAGGISLWRTTHGGTEISKQKVFKLSNSLFVQLYFKYILLPKWRFATKAQGLGLHTKEEVMEFMFTDLRAVSRILGNKPFILGDTPCEDDCGIFGVLAQVVWGSPESPYEKLVKEELPNLVAYCERMKAAYWKDWDKQLARV